VLGLQSKPLDRAEDSRAEQNPEDGANVRRGEASGTAYGCAGGRKLWRGNPKSGSGMK